MKEAFSRSCREILSQVDSKTNDTKAKLTIFISSAKMLTNLVSVRQTQRLSLRTMKLQKRKNKVT